MNIGKKILSAFVEVTEEEKPVTQTKTPATAAIANQPTIDTSKFKQYFDKLFAEANIPGPDYFEFSKMVEAMKAIQDEKARYIAAFAGLSVQGLDKQKLLSTATGYLQLLDTDATNFSATIDGALQEKVRAKQLEIEEKTKRIQQLSLEITDLHSQIAELQKEVNENEEKIQANTGGYKAELENRKSSILLDIEKIKEHIN
jgi:hypothetical protein